MVSPSGSASRHFPTVLLWRGGQAFSRRQPFRSALTDPTGTNVFVQRLQETNLDLGSKQLELLRAYRRNWLDLAILVGMLTLPTLAAFTHKPIAVLCAVLPSLLCLGESVALGRSVVRLKRSGYALPSSKLFPALWKAASIALGVWVPIALNVWARATP
jgi:hypothetical protein